MRRENRIFALCVTVGKIGLALAILVYLFLQVQQQDGFVRLRNDPKDWSGLGLGIVLLWIAVVLGFARWYVLVRGMQLPFRLADAMRLGAVGFALNFVALGNVGGDLFKAIFIARRQPERKTAAVATVLADRIVGLLTMLLVACAAILIMNLDRTGGTAAVVMCRATLACTSVGLTGIIAVLWLPGLDTPRLRWMLAKVPVVGATLEQLLTALVTYRSNKHSLLVACGLSLCVDVLFVLSFFSLAKGLPVSAPGLPEHFLIVPLSVIGGALPITPNGAGTFELVIEMLYRALLGETLATPGDGTIVALAHRVAMIVVAGACLLLFAVRKRQPLPATQPA